jgi:hypothetical protein
VGVHESVLTASLRAVVGAFRRLHRVEQADPAPRGDIQPVA